MAEKKIKKTFNNVELWIRMMLKAFKFGAILYGYQIMAEDLLNQRIIYRNVTEN